MANYPEEVLTRKKMRVFLSYNSADKDYVRKLAATLTLAGAQVWFDEWTIRPGDSIPSAVESGLTRFDTFVLVWSEAASRSRWVRTEMEAALDRWLKGDPCRLIPLLLDATPVPTLLRSVRYIDGRDKDQTMTARVLLGIESETAFLLAVQEFIDEAGLEFREFWGVGVLVACPRCGATPDKIEGWEAIDERRDDRYIGAKCTVCGWSDGSEV